MDDPEESVVQSEDPDLVPVIVFLSHVILVVSVVVKVLVLLLTVVTEVVV